MQCQPFLLVNQGCSGPGAEECLEFLVLTVSSLEAPSVPLVNSKGLHRFSKSAQIKHVLWDYCGPMSMQQEAANF